MEASCRSQVSIIFNLPPPSVNFSWKTLNVEEYGGSYRRLFMEKTFQDKIENFVPNQSDYEEVDAFIELVKRRRNVGNMFGKML